MMSGIGEKLPNDYLMLFHLQLLYDIIGELNKQIKE